MTGEDKLMQNRLMLNQPKICQVYPVIYALLCALLVLSWAGSAAPSTPAADAGAGSGIILELNDSTVNETIALYPFFVSTSRYAIPARE